MLPTLFISHGGGPWPFMDFGAENPYAGLAAYLQQWPRDLPSTPKALLVVSGHWEEPVFTVNIGARPPMLYDYYGFPEHTYRVRYDAPGSPEVAGRVGELLGQAGIASATDDQRGFDHGVFSPFVVSHPKADVPIVQLSMKIGYDPAEHLAAGRALMPLRDEGVMIVGSGLSFHNLRAFGPQSLPGAKAFDDWLTEAVTQPDAAERNRRLMQWAQAPGFRVSHPREDHLVPLLVVAGAAGDDRGVKSYSDEMRGLPVSGFQFG
jgi:aromatic ring-opening dioxygenase catalytic subunit (LigB family)